jgi:hypothetical protein
VKILSSCNYDAVLHSSIKTIIFEALLGLQHKISEPTLNDASFAFSSEVNNHVVTTNDRKLKIKELEVASSGTMLRSCFIKLSVGSKVITVQGHGGTHGRDGNINLHFLVKQGK